MDCKISTFFSWETNSILSENCNPTKSVTKTDCQNYVFIITMIRDWYVLNKHGLLFPCPYHIAWIIYWHVVVFCDTKSHGLSSCFNGRNKDREFRFGNPLMMNLNTVRITSGMKLLIGCAKSNVSYENTIIHYKII